MSKRVAWLVVSVGLPVLLLAQLGGFPSLIQAGADASVYDVIINEWSQGNGGSKEWVELLVVNGPADLRGWDVGDESPGDLTFSQDVLWTAVPAGTRIVIYNARDRDTILPPDDADVSDCAAIVPDEDAALFSGRLPAFSNGSSVDKPHLRDALGVTIHDFGSEPGGINLGANQTAVYTANVASGVADGANWTAAAASAATPGAGNGGLNSSWVDGLCQSGQSGAANLIVSKSGPTAVQAGDVFTYQIGLSNNGGAAATAVILTDSLPSGIRFLADDSGYSLSQPDGQTLVWHVGDVLTGSAISFNLTVSAALTVSGSVTNTIWANAAVTETTLADNVDTAVTLVHNRRVLIDRVLYDGYELGELDEAVRLINLNSAPVSVGGWQISDGSATAVIPDGTTIPAGGGLWLTQKNAGFRRQFGFDADFEGKESDAAVPNLTGWPGFANSGDEVILRDSGGGVVDVLVYAAGNTGQAGWSGAAVAHYGGGGLFGKEGQILFRRRDQRTGLPVMDTDTAADWAQMRDDVIDGRKVLYPGWQESFFWTAQVTETAVITLAIAPDNGYQAIINQLNTATETIRIETHTFENLGIGAALVAAANRGVSVTVLLEGSPPGGLPDQERFICQQIETAGGSCWFMINDPDQRIYDRYRFLHAKFVLVDGRRVIISSENLSPNSLPDDDKSDGTWGRRGAALITDAPGVVSHVQSIFDADFDTANHVDLFRWQAGHPQYGAPPIGFTPITQTGGTTYTVRYSQTAVFSGTFAFELVQSPENSLRDVDGLLGLINRAGAGDEVMAQQLAERPYWGDNPVDDPNPRLEAYINAARRGARVRILLDEFFDDRDSPTSNYAACRYVDGVALAERLNLDCALGNPAGLGIHNKMVLVRVNGRGAIHIGSINGSEQSSKGNRELAIQVQSDAAFAYLAEMFDHDWPYRTYLPVLFHNYIGPAQYTLISEVLYDPPGGQDDAEFIELVNPTGQSVDLSGYSLGDAVNREDYEDVRRFPAGTVLGPGQTLVVATTAVAFFQDHGFNPDFEIADSDSQVPDLIDDVGWGNTAVILRLGNGGDELILRDPNDQVVDVITYGTGAFPGVIGCPLITLANASLERVPYWRDTNDCPYDFREWAFPSPGQLP